jgi:hypothetical protein
MDSVPKWARQFNEKKFLQLYLSREWNILKPKSTYNQSLPDNNSYEKGFDNKQRTFPYQLAELSRTEGMNLINFTPFGNNYIIDFAINAILNENLGKDQYTDLLTISLPTSGNVTDLFGIRSVELQDIYIRLDNDIAHILEFIDDKFGKEKVLVILTSDKGASDNYNFMKDVGIPVGKFYPAQSVSLLESYLKALYGKSGWVKKYSDKQIYLNDLTIDASKTPVGEVQMKAAQFLSQFQAVANATTAHVLHTTEFVEGDFNKFQNSFNLARSGDVLISLKPGYVEENIMQMDEINGSNSPYRYDSHVPVIFYGWKIRQNESGVPVSITDVAATLSRILDISLPSGTQGKVIEEMFKE